MSQNAAIDIAIGLILMYLVLSLLCTVINEFIATKLKLRANNLATGLRELLDDPTLQRTFYDHGLIRGSQTAPNHPSYLSAETFALALVGALTGNRLDRNDPTPTFADVQRSIEALPATATRIKGALQASLIAAQGDFSAFRTSVMTWFDDSMDRVGGIYKRHLKRISIVVGLAVAVLMNADSFAVGRALWSDGPLRAQMIKAGEAAAKSGLPEDQKTQELSAVAKTYREADEILRPLPIGWPLHDWPSDQAGRIWFCITKLAGWFATALALSLGAPFWFDLLSKFINLRGAGAKPDRQDAKAKI